MSEQLNTAALLKVLNYRKIRAEIAVLDQQKIVESCQTELLKATDDVIRLEQQIQENKDYRQRETVLTDPVKICESMSHRKQIEYQLERERFYQSVALEELQTALAVLQSKKSTLEKIKVKQDRVTHIRKTQLTHAEFLRQDILEEEMAGILHARSPQ